METKSMVSEPSSNQQWTEAFGIVNKLSLLVDAQIICRELLRSFADLYPIQQQYYYEKIADNLVLTTSWPLIDATENPPISDYVMGIFNQTPRIEYTTIASGMFIALPIKIYEDQIGVWVIEAQHDQANTVRLDIVRHLGKFLGNQLYMSRLIQTFQNRFLENLSLINQEALDKEKALIAQARTEALFDFLTDTSHDFLTPVTTIMSAASLLQRIADPTGRAQKINQIETSAKNLERKIRQVMFITQLRHNQVTDFDLSTQSLYELQNYLDFRIFSKLDVSHINLQIINTIEDTKKVFFRLHLGYLATALGNIIDNSLRYATTSITVSFTQSASELQITVSDDGLGIPEEIMSRVSEPLFRGEAYRPQNAGHGLGLPIAKLIVERMQGSILIRNNSPSGSSAIISLPIQTNQ